ncbi:MAG: FhaA domain-containing protein [Ferrimicrobium sp.]
MSLEQFERRVAAVVDSLFARGSSRGIEPAELGRRLVREIERSCRIGVRSEIAPNVLTIGVSPQDGADLKPMRNTVISELKKLAQETIEHGGFQLLGSLEVRLTEDAELHSGTFYVDCAFVEEPGFMDRWALRTSDGMAIPLSSGTYSVGRLAGCEVFVDDPRVSRRHAEINVRDGIVALTDLGSTNGTVVNGQRVSRPTELQEGDVITVGTTEFTLQRG